MDCEKCPAYGRKRERERDQQLRGLELMYQDKLAHLVQSHIHPSLWFIVERALAEHPWIPPFNHSLRSDEWTAKLRNHRILGYMGSLPGTEPSTTNSSKQ